MEEAAVLREAVVTPLVEMVAGKVGNHLLSVRCRSQPFLKSIPK
jgi:hypothetical protein